MAKRSGAVGDPSADAGVRRSAGTARSTAPSTRSLAAAPRSSAAGPDAVPSPRPETNPAARKAAPKKAAATKAAAAAPKTATPKTATPKTATPKTAAPKTAKPPAAKTAKAAAPKAAPAPEAVKAAPKAAAAGKAAPKTVKAAAKPAKAAPKIAKAAPKIAKAVSSPRGWTSLELAEVRADLESRRSELRQEVDAAISDIAQRQRDGGGDGAGDDQADAGAKTFEREHEISLAHNSRVLLDQVERALQRIATGTYGSCESCGNPIPKARLQAFPSATLCVTCKQREERR